MLDGPNVSTGMLKKILSDSFDWNTAQPKQAIISDYNGLLWGLNLYLLEFTSYC